MYGSLGTYVMVICTLSFVLSCLFLPSLMSKYIGYKWSLIISQMVFFCYILANFLPYSFTLLPIGFFMGLANAG